MRTTDIIALTKESGEQFYPQTHAEAVKGLVVPKKIRDLTDKGDVIYLGAMFGEIPYEYPPIYVTNLVYLCDSAGVALFAYGGERLTALDLDDDD